MKISEVIIALLNILVEHGDLMVHISVNSFYTEVNSVATSSYWDGKGSKEGLEVFAVLEQE